MEFIKTITIKDTYMPIESFIYVLWDKVKDVPFYVGKTTNPSNRFSTHLNEYGKNITAKTIYIKEILDIDPNGIEMRIIERTDTLYWSEREQYWIREISKNYDLTNHTCNPIKHNKRDDYNKDNKWKKTWEDGKLILTKRITEKIQ